MENWNQDHPENNRDCWRLYIKGQGHRKLTSHSHGWSKTLFAVKACVNICEHTLKLSNLVSVGVLINNYYYK